MTTKLTDIIEIEALIQCRRDIHAHPETAFEEFRTASLVAERLTAMGFDEVHENIATTGVVGILHGASGPGRMIGLRADMDALNLDELNDIPHKSRHDGKMHACGHDGHTAMLLGAAAYFSAHRDYFNGTLCFIFQPAEEGAGGAKVMIQEGLFERFPVESVWGLHNWPSLPAGKIAVHTGPVMASSDYFRITVKGQGGHGAMPHLGADPVIASAHVTLALQTLVSRNVDPVDAAVVSVTMMEGAHSSNVIPDKAVLTGTVRALQAETRQQLREGVERIAMRTAQALGCEAELDYRWGYPVTVNTKTEASVAAQAAAAVLGEDAVVLDAKPTLGAEDFGYMLEEKPGCYIWLGGGDGEHTQGLHHPEYDFNDNTLVTGVCYWIELVKRCLPTK